VDVGIKRKFNLSSICFDPHTSFLNLTIIWITTGFFCLLAIISMVVIIVNSELRCNWSYSGFNNVLTIFKVPLSFLAMVIPTVALFAANHRSEQTKEQMRLANVQNNFANYYKHQEEFEKFCEKDIENSKNRIILPLKFHILAFPKATEGVYSVAENFIEEMDDFLIKILKISEELDVREFGEENSISRDLKEDLKYFSSKYNIGGYGRTTDKPIPFLTSSSNMREFVDKLQIVIMVIRDALRFDPALSRCFIRV